MQEGYWGNYQTGIWFEIDEHEMWIRRAENAARLGVPDNIYHRFRDFQLQVDRDKLLAFLFQHAPVMRIRGHGTSVSFEFHAQSWQQPLSVIEHWCRRHAGPYTELRLVNFHGMAIRNFLWQDWTEQTRDLC